MSEASSVQKRPFEQAKLVQWNLDITKGKGLPKYVRYNEVSLYRGSFLYILLLLGPGKSFVILRTSLNRAGSTVSKGGKFP